MPEIEHPLTPPSEPVGAGIRYRATCSCGNYRSSREQVKATAERAAWQHCRRMGVKAGKPATGSSAF